MVTDTPPSTEPREYALAGLAWLRLALAAWLLPLVAAAWACDAGGRAGDDAAASADQPGEVPGELLPPADNRFDAGRLRAGDPVLDLTVANIEVEPAPAPHTGYVGSVEFRGRVTVSGRYRGHPDYPEPGADLVCFFVNGETAARLPRFREDERYPWFCFTNRAQAAERLGPPDTEGVATVVIDGYRTERRFTDVFDTATLVEVLSKDDSVAPVP
jgi:hypothetical protein